MNFNKKLLLFFLVILITTSKPSQKKDIGDIPLLNVPSEILENIVSFLPELEHNKMLSISNSLSNEVRNKYYANLYSENTLTQAFKNYLMYPHLSRFNINHQASLTPFTYFQGQKIFNTDDETNTLQGLLQQKDNKKLFYSLLFREVHPDYLNQKEWRETFGITHRRTKLDDLAKGSYIDVMYFKHHKTRRLLTPQDINKIMVIHIGRSMTVSARELVDQVAGFIWQGILNNEFVTENDRFRIIFTYGQNSLDPQDSINFYTQNILYLAKRLSKNLSDKNIYTNVVDITKLPVGHLYNNLDLLNLVVPQKSLLYVTLDNDILMSTIKQNFPKIIPRPYYRPAEPVLPLIRNSQGQYTQNLYQDGFNYLCERNFTLMLIPLIFPIVGGTPNFKICVDILDKYVSPFALMHDGRTFLDYLFSYNNTNEDTKNLIAIVRKHRIDINNYYSPVLGGTFLTYLLRNSNTPFTGFDLSQIEAFINQGVDLFSKIDHKNLLEYFFSGLAKFGAASPEHYPLVLRIGGLLTNGPSLPSIKQQQIDMFTQLLNHQKRPFLDKNGNKKTIEDILFTYFKYADCFNDMLINNLLDHKELNINAKNEKNETLFESFLNFIVRVIERDTTNIQIRMSPSIPTPQQQIFSQYLFAPIDAIFNKFIQRKFNFQQVDSKLIENYPELPWEKVRILINRQYKNR